MIHIYLFEVYALAAGVGPSQELHSPVFQIQICVVWNERTDHHLLQWVP